MNFKIYLSCLVLFLVGCQSAPNPMRSLTVEQCSINMVFKTVLIVDQQTNETSTREILDPDKTECFCRPYKFSLEYMGPTGGATFKEISHCNKMIGNRPDSYLKQTNFLGDVRKDIQNSMP